VGEYFLDFLEGKFGAEVNGFDVGHVSSLAVAQECGAEEFVCNAVGGGEEYDLHGGHGCGPWVKRGLWGG